MAATQVSQAETEAGEEEEGGAWEAGSLTWYVLSKLSYMNLVIRDVFPTARQKERDVQLEGEPDRQGLLNTCTGERLAYKDHRKGEADSRKQIPS